MKRTALFTSLIAAAFFVSVYPAVARGQSCSSVIHEEIAKAGISDADVEKISVSIYEVGDSVRRGYLAWVSLKGKSGSFLVSLTPICLTQQVYTRGGLEIPGVKSF